MSEQAVLVKNAIKSKGKTSLLSGLLKAGKIDTKEGAEFAKKFLELTKKGEVEPKKIPPKSKKGESQNEEIGAVALLQIKSLLSQIRLNDKLGVEKTIKNLRELSGKDSKNGEILSLKKLLEVAKEGGLDVKKIEIERVDEESLKSEIDGKKESKNDQKKVALKGSAKDSLSTTSTTDEDAREALFKLSREIKEQKSTKEEIKKVEIKELPKGAMPEELKKEEIKEPKNTTHEEPKRGEIKEGELKLKKDSSPLAQALLESKKEEPKKGEKKEVQKVAMPEEPKRGVRAFEGEAVLLKALEGIEQFGKKGDSFNDESIQNENHKDEGKVKLSNNFELERTQKHQSMELKAKMAAASEGLKNFSKDLWEVVENYRPPLMKVSMELNPQNLGSVDVTLISRGQNLIVNISSSQETMQIFMQNIQEFRQNLMAQGFVSLQMNFNFSDQKGDGQRWQWQREAVKKYAANGEDIGKIESLDIVIPHPKYA